MLKTTVCIAVLFLMYPNVHAFGGPCVMGRDGGLDSSLASDLHLSEDQKSLIESLHDSFEREYRPMQNQLFSKRGELERLWAEADPDQGQILAKQQEIREIQCRIQEMATNYRFKRRGVLSPEQRKKLAEHSDYYARGAKSGHRWTNYGW